MSMQSIRFLLKFIMILLLIMFLILIIYNVSLHLNQVKDIALDFNAYSNLILAFLTAALVFITAFYALITHRMLAQMKESRQSLVRPILWVAFDKPEFKESEYPHDDAKGFWTKAHISNYGKGAAVNIHTEYRIPNEWSDEHKCVMSICSNGIGEIPSLLSPGSSFDIKVGIRTKTSDVDELYHTYLTVRVLYEDTERNLYEMKQSYYLLPEPTTGHYLHLETESLCFVPLSNRKSVRDDRESISSKGVLIFDRQLPWRWK